LSAKTRGGSGQDARESGSNWGRERLPEGKGKKCRSKMASPASTNPPKDVEIKGSLPFVSWP